MVWVGRERCDVGKPSHDAHQHKTELDDTGKPSHDAHQHKTELSDTGKPSHDVHQHKTDEAIRDTKILDIDGSVIRVASGYNHIESVVGYILPLSI